MSQMVGIKSGLHHHHSWALDDDDRQRLCSVYSKADDAFMTHRVFSLLAGWLIDDLSCEEELSFIRWPVLSNLIRNRQRRLHPFTLHRWTSLCHSSSHRVVVASSSRDLISITWLIRDHLVTQINSHFPSHSLLLNSRSNLFVSTGPLRIMIIYSDTNCPDKAQWTTISRPHKKRPFLFPNRFRCISWVTHSSPSASCSSAQNRLSD